MTARDVLPVPGPCVEDPAASVEPAVVVGGVSYSYGINRILNEVDISLARGQILALLGPSGCGKTTLLRLIAGLLSPSAGRIEIHSIAVADARSRRFIPPEGRGLGMAFQDYALWPHMSVGENVGFPLEMRGVGRGEREARVAAALDRVGLTGFGPRRPDSLSGGQQQRVSIARAIVAEPRLVLFDEPLSNLDKELRDSLSTEIGSLIRNLGLTAIYVTHDQGEAFSLADQVAVMQSGKIVQLASPEQLVEHPASAEVADFLGLGTLLPAFSDGSTVQIEGTAVSFPTQEVGAPNKARVRGLAFLPRRAIRICPVEQATLCGDVTRSVFRGERYLIGIRIGNLPGLEITAGGDIGARPGAVVGVALDCTQARFFPIPKR